jgi:nucleotide-binding universal stress UspA family protein
MTSAEKQAFLAGIRIKTNWELGRLRVLHPGLQAHELIFKAHEAVVDHWFEFEKPSDPRRKTMESHLIEKFFEDCKKQLAEKRRPPSLTITTSFGADFDSVCASPPAISAEEFHAHFDPNNEKYREVSAWQEALLMVMTTRRATRRTVETSTFSLLLYSKFYQKLLGDHFCFPCGGSIALVPTAACPPHCSIICVPRF